MEFMFWDQVPQWSNHAGQQVLSPPTQQIIFLCFFPSNFCPTESVLIDLPDKSRRHQIYT